MPALVIEGRLAVFGWLRKKTDPADLSIDSRVEKAAEEVFQQVYSAALQQDTSAVAREKAEAAALVEAQRILIAETRAYVVRGFVNYAQIAAKQAGEKPPWPMGFQIAAAVFDDVAGRIGSSHGDESRVAIDAMRLCIDQANNILTEWANDLLTEPRDRRADEVGIDYVDRPEERVKQLVSNVAPRWVAEHGDELERAIASLAPLWKKYDLAHPGLTDLGFALQDTIISAMQRFRQ